MFERSNLNKLTAVFMAAAMMFLVSGCSAVPSSAKSLMTPPSYSQDQQAIVSLLKSDEGHTDFAYPNSGEYRSAVIMRDITGDGVSEALGFIHNSKGITIKFMEKHGEGNWEIMEEYDNNSSQIDRVLFGDVNGDGADDVIVGWGSPDSMTAKAAVYIYDNEKVKEFYLGRAYNAITVTDLDNDKVNEIFTATIYSQPKEDLLEINDAEARLYTMESNYPNLKFCTELSKSIVKYTTVTVGKVADNKEAVVLEGIDADFNGYSQVVCLNVEKSNLITPMSTGQMIKKYDNFSRPPVMETSSRDIDGDGILEFPMVRMTAGHSKNISLHSTAYLITWVKLEPFYGSREVRYTFEDYKYGFRIDIPKEYKDNVVVYRDQRVNEYNFYLVECDDTGLVTQSEHMFKIKVFTKESWLEKGLQDGFRILRYGEQVLGYKEFVGSSGLDELPYTFEDIE